MGDNTVLKLACLYSDQFQTVCNVAPFGLFRVCSTGLLDNDWGRDAPLDVSLGVHSQVVTQRPLDNTVLKLARLYSDQFQTVCNVAPFGLFRFCSTGLLDN